MGHSVYWDRDKGYYTACEICGSEKQCPRSIDFDAHADRDSDVSYVIHQTNKANKYLENLLCPKCEARKKTESS